MSESKQYRRRDFLQLFSAGAVAFSCLNDQELFAGFYSNLSSVDEKRFVPVMITPFTTDGKIDFENLSRLIDFYLASGAKGFFANCLSSEMYKLEPDERIALAKHVVSRVKGKATVVASGSFGNNTEGQATFTKRMYATGVNAVILITSHFANKEDSDEILIANFEKFLSATAGIPIGTYECPSPYKRVLTPTVFKYLLSTNRLIYHKDTTLDVAKVKEKLALAKGTKLELYDAHTPNAMYSLQAGAKGMSAIAGNFYPEIFSWLCENVNRQDQQENVNWIQAELTRVDPIISNGYPMSSKYFLRKRGLPIELICRTNNTPLFDQQIHNLDMVLADLNHWRERLNIK
ncbi:MAG: dihydrodipicolinate synthase family protein [Chitinophagaceae bacterium]